MGEERDVLESLLLEMRRGTLVLGVLSQLDKPQYGYALVQRMESRGVPIDPNTLYPLLRRLEKQGLLESRWETDGPKPRKYYRRTPYGETIFETLRQQWREMSAGVENLLKKETD
ncbi:MAG TPA: PadR family transcriptional regulator [Candidatus Ruminococcus gallistercoris]|jgi:PadR family transcriptional regulator PadR|nr:PadR family transcriptional regulator [Candidatus Ruminococcus gallistercoris]